MTCSHYVWGLMESLRLGRMESLRVEEVWERREEAEVGPAPALSLCLHSAASSGRCAFVCSANPRITGSREKPPYGRTEKKGMSNPLEAQNINFNRVKV